MSQIKAIDMVELRKLLYQKDLFEQYMSMLDIEARRTFTNLLATTWVSLEIYSQFVSAAAKLLFPSEDDPIHEVGRLLTPRTLNFVYKAFIRIPRVSFLAKRAAFIWRTYYQKGNMQAVDTTPNSTNLIVTNFPELPTILLRKNGGSIRGILELTEANNVQVTVDAHHPNAWQYHVSWD